MATLIMMGRIIITTIMTQHHLRIMAALVALLSMELASTASPSSSTTRLPTSDTARPLLGRAACEAEACSAAALTRVGRCNVLPKACSAVALTRASRCNVLSKALRDVPPLPCCSFVMFPARWKLG